jgi:hypothetical protein
VNGREVAKPTHTNIPESNKANVRASRNLKKKTLLLVLFLPLYQERKKKVTSMKETHTQKQTSW